MNRLKLDCGQISELVIRSISFLINNMFRKRRVVAIEKKKFYSETQAKVKNS